MRPLPLPDTGLGSISQQIIHFVVVFCCAQKKFSMNRLKLMRNKTFSKLLKFHFSSNLLPHYMSRLVGVMTEQFHRVGSNNKSINLIVRSFSLFVEPSHHSDNFLRKSCHNLLKDVVAARHLLVVPILNFIKWMIETTRATI